MSLTSCLIIYFRHWFFLHIYTQERDFYGKKCKQNAEFDALSAPFERMRSKKSGHVVCCLSWCEVFVFGPGRRARMGAGTVPLAIFLVFLGCASNVVFLEMIVK